LTKHNHTDWPKNMPWIVDDQDADCVGILAGLAITKTKIVLPHKNAETIKKAMMSNETTENFLKVMAEFKWPDPVPVSYRLYYNDDGTPKCYAMEDLPGKYIEIDSYTYALSPWNVRVVDEKIHFIEPVVTVKKLKPNENSGTACHPSDVCVVVDQKESHTKWKLTTNETH
jgi:hypothetical protein